MQSECSAIPIVSGKTRVAFVVYKSYEASLRESLRANCESNFKARTTFLTQYRMKQVSLRRLSPVHVDILFIAFHASVGVYAFSRFEPKHNLQSGMRRR